MNLWAPIVGWSGFYAGWLAASALGTLLSWSWFGGLLGVVLWWLWLVLVPAWAPSRLLVLSPRLRAALAAGAVLALAIAMTQGSGPIAQAAAALAIGAWAHLTVRWLLVTGHDAVGTSPLRSLTIHAVAVAVALVIAGDWEQWRHTWPLALLLLLGLAALPGPVCDGCVQRAQQQPPTVTWPMGWMMGSLALMGQWCSAMGWSAFVSTAAHLAVMVVAMFWVDQTQVFRAFAAGGPRWVALRLGGVLIVAGAVAGWAAASPGWMLLAVAAITLGAGITRLRLKAPCQRAWLTIDRAFTVAAALLLLMWGRFADAVGPAFGWQTVAVLGSLGWLATYAVPVLSRSPATLSLMRPRS